MPSIINLPLMETVRRSFLYVVKNSKEFLKITSVFIILWIADILRQPLFPSASFVISS